MQLRAITAGGRLAAQLHRCTAAVLESMCRSVRGDEQDARCAFSSPACFKSTTAGVHVARRTGPVSWPLGQRVKHTHVRTGGTGTRALRYSSSRIVFG